jgi:hypothetical protein
VKREKSSTMVRKYLTPLRELIEKGLQISQWIKSKILLELEVLTGKGKRCCLAKGHIVQYLFEFTDMLGSY